jgi:hypothetical protein
LSCHASAQSLPHERAAGDVRGYRRMDLLKVLHLQHIGKAPTKGRNRTARRLKIFGRRHFFSLLPPALGERGHRGLPRRLVASARAYVGFVRANVAEYDITEVCHRSRGRFVIRCPILA